MSPELKAFSDGLIAIVKGHVAKIAEAIGARIDAIDKALLELTESQRDADARARAELSRAVAELPKPENGKDADPAMVIKAAREALEALPKPADGKSVTVEEVTPLLEQLVKTAVEALPKPQQIDQGAIVAAVHDAVLRDLPQLPDIPALVTESVRRAFEALPKPENGKDADEEAIARRVLDKVAPQLPKLPDLPALVAAAVEKAVDALPRPKNGKDADPELMAQAIQRAVAAIELKGVEPEAVRAMVAEAVAALPKPADGKSVTLEEVAPLIAEAASKLPKPENGKDADPELIRQLVAHAVAAIPKPQDGKSITLEEVAPVVAQAVKTAVEALPAPKEADPAAIAALLMPQLRLQVQEHLDAIPAPEDGKSVVAADLAPMVAEVVRASVDALPKPRDGESVPLEQVRRMVAEEVAKAMAGVRLPKDGEPGRDAAHIEILPAINEAKSYPRGTFARHDGGLWRSYETTTGMKGWECIADAIADVTLEQLGERTVAIEVRLASGKTTRKEVVFPVTIHRGIWKDTELYARGDATTRDGSTWILMIDQQKGKPGDEGSGWQLSTKRGRDGKPGNPGKKGEPGKPGRPGRDLTQLGFDGSKH